MEPLLRQRQCLRQCSVPQVTHIGSMETRFKKFINTRRGRSSTVSGNDLVHQSAPYETSAPASRPPIFLYQPLAKSALEIRRDCEKDVVPMRSLSYDQVAPGKAPVFIQSLPQKGNGPVKLQTNRRLSSGELITTAEDSQKTLQDIRDGDYVVGKKERSVSSCQSRSNTNVNEPRMSHVQSINYSPLPTPSPCTSTASRTWPNSPCLIQDSPQSGVLDNVDPGVSNVGLGLSSSASTFVSRPRPSQDSHIDYKSSFQRQSASYESSPSYYHSMQNGNATLQALRKAEYSRLVEIYGADAAARSLARLDGEHLNAAISPTPSTRPFYSPVILEPLPAPPADTRDAESRRTSHMSRTSSEWSGTSSPQRRSCVSSYAESSTATAQTSVAEDDPVTTREDIRNMVEQMRSTYLNAFEQRTPPAARSKPRKKKQRKRKLMPSPALNAPDQHSPRAPPLSGRQTWHPDDSDHDAPFTRRINSQPVSGTGRLSPIQASPRRNDDKDVGIKRADSSTLGGLMADLTRSRIRSSQSSKRSTDQKHASLAAQASHLRPVTPRQPPQGEKQDSWLNLESDSAEELPVESPRDVFRPHQLPRVVSHHSVEKYESEHVDARVSNSFEGIYEDLFGKESSDFWASTTDLGRLSPPHIPPSDATDKIAVQRSTPSKTSQMISTPDSPKYDLLTRRRQISGNFI